MSRKINKGFTELDFIPLKKENKYFAYCTYCGHELSNTAFCRLQAHRSICKNKNTTQEIATCSNVNENSEIVLQNNTEETISNEIELNNMAIGLESSQLIEFVTSNSIHNDKMDIQIIDITNQNNEADKENISNLVHQENSTSTISLTASKSIVSRTSIPASPSLIKPSIKRRKKKELLSNFIDQVSDKQLNEFNTKLSTFFFGCNKKIPASSAQIERVFSSWSFVHSSIRNRLDFERSRKLLHIYYTHKITDSNICNDY